jgi:hypothetical protein
MFRAETRKLLRRIFEAVRATVAAIRQQVCAVALQSERTLMLGAPSCWQWRPQARQALCWPSTTVDVLTSLVAQPHDCWADSGLRIGAHCFSDYPVTETVAMGPNQWEPIWLRLASRTYNPLRIEYPAAGLVPHLLLGTVGKWFGTPQLGLVVVLAILIAAVSAPAVWAARCARGLERIVVFLACGAAAVPAWVAIDRGNLVGLIAPIALVFLVALRRRRWGIVAIAVVLAALVEPQFAILFVVVFAVRQLRRGGAAVAGVPGATAGIQYSWMAGEPRAEQVLRRRACVAIPPVVVLGHGDARVLVDFHRVTVPRDIGSKLAQIVVHKRFGAFERYGQAILLWPRPVRPCQSICSPPLRQQSPSIGGNRLAVWAPTVANSFSVCPMGSGMSKRWCAAKGGRRAARSVMVRAFNSDVNSDASPSEGSVQLMWSQFQDSVAVESRHGENEISVCGNLPGELAGGEL